MSHKLVGNQLNDSETIQKLLDQTAQEVLKLNQVIEGPKDPDEALVQRNKEMAQRIADYRGRPLFYPYISTGAGNGPYVELEDGSVKLDLINGIGIHILGHSHPSLIRASLRASLSDVVMQGHLQANLDYLRLGESLVELASKNSRLKHAWISTSGSMANENALKMSRQKNSPARKIIAMKNAFAGRTTMMAEVTDNPSYKQGLPEYNEILRVPFYDPKKTNSSEESLRILKEHVANNEGDICSFVFEPMLGEGGYQSAPRDFFVPLLEFCREKKIAVWADEVQTFCRTGELFAFETLNIGEYIDLCTIAKTLQVAATLYTEEYNPKPGLIAGTFAGSSVSLKCGLAVLQELTQGDYFGPNGKIQKIHQNFVAMLNELNETSCKGLLQDAGGMGLMVAVTPHDGTRDKMLAVLKALYKNGLMTFGCGKGPFRLRFLIPAVMAEKDIAVAKTIIEKSIQETV